METQDALSRVEERFRELVEWVPAVVYEAAPGPDGVFHYISPQIEEMLGYTPAEWLADPRLWFECIHPDDRGPMLELEREQEEQSRRVRPQARERVPDAAPQRAHGVGPRHRPDLRGRGRPGLLARRALRHHRRAQRPAVARRRPRALPRDRRGTSRLRLPGRGRRPRSLGVRLRARSSSWSATARRR